MKPSPFPNSDGLDPPADEAGATWLNVCGRSIFGIWRSPRKVGRTALVFLHDGLGSVGTMRGFPMQIARELDLPAFVFDRPGYGRSGPESEFPDDFMGDAADFLENLLASAKINDCCLVGHSDGGTIALLHGARFRGRVRAIVTIAAHVRRDELTYGQVLRHSKMYSEGDIPDWMTRFHGDNAPHLLKCWTDVWQKKFYDSWDISKEISGIAVPLMSLQGTEDAYGLPSQLESITNAVPSARTEMIAGLGHFPHLEDPPEIIARVRDFLSPYCRL